jgi:hypothetical protein
LYGGGVSSQGLKVAVAEARHSPAEKVNLLDASEAPLATKGRPERTARPGAGSSRVLGPEGKHFKHLLDLWPPGSLEHKKGF